VGAAAAALWALPCGAGAGVIEADLTNPTLDRWMYPFNCCPGEKTEVSIFGATIEGGFHPDFDNRDGQGLVGFATSAQIEPGLGVEAYQVIAAVLTLTVLSDGTFQYDPTPDPFTSWLQPDDARFQPDPDPGRPVELFGAGFRNGWSATTFPENGPFCNGCSCFPPNSCVAVRNVYPVDFSGGCEHRDVSNNVSAAFDPSPWAVGTSDALSQGQPVPADTELSFAIAVGDSCIQQYLRQALDQGMLDLVVASIFPAQQQQEGTFPKLYTKENPLAILGLVVAGRLQLTVNVGVPGDLDGDGVVGITDLLILLSDWGRCPPGPCTSDLDRDGAVGITDLLILLANWG
jgi:hypothetical protein